MCARRIELIYGGAASGKSGFAEAEALKCTEPFYYLATMRRGSETGDRRIKRHEMNRAGKGFITMECPVNIGTAADRIDGGTVLLECLTNLAANEMFTTDEHDDGLCDKILQDILAFGRKAENFIIVSGDIMRDGEVYSKETEAYIRLIGTLNAKLTAVSDKAYEIVYGCPKRIK